MGGVSLLVPCLNEADGLPDFVARVRDTLDHSPVTAESGWELILIDDGSTDATSDCIAGLQRGFPALRAVRHPQQSGIPAAWRTGVAHARGDCVCVIDADL